MDQQYLSTEPAILRPSSPLHEIVVIRDDRFLSSNSPLRNSGSLHVPSRSGVQDQVGEINPQPLPCGNNLGTPTEYNTNMPMDLSRGKKEIPNHHPKDQQLAVQDNGQASGLIRWDAQGRAEVDGELVVDHEGLPFTRNDKIRYRKFIPVAVVGFAVTKTFSTEQAIQITNNCRKFGNNRSNMDPQGANNSNNGQANAENSEMDTSLASKPAGVDPNFHYINVALRNNLIVPQNPYKNYPCQDVQIGNAVFPLHPPYEPYIGPARFVPQVNGNTNGGIRNLNYPKEQEGVLDLSGRKTPSKKEEKAYRKQCFVKRRSMKQTRSSKEEQGEREVPSTSSAPGPSNSSEIYRPESPTNDDIDVGIEARAMRGSYFPEFSMGFQNNGIRNFNLQQNQYNSYFGYEGHANNVSGNDSSASIAMPPLDPNHYNMQSHFGIRNAGRNPLLVQKHLDNGNNGIPPQLPLHPGPCTPEQLLQHLFDPNPVNPPQEFGLRGLIRRGNGC